MARTELEVQEIVRAGVEPTYEAANSDGEEFANADSARTFLHVKNGSGGSINVTIVTPNVVDDDLAVGDRVVAVPAGEERMIGEFPPANYNQSDDTVDVNFSAVGSVTVAVFHI